MDSMSDLMHGLGASFVAACFVSVAWLALYFWLCHEPLPPSWPVLIMHVLFAVVLWIALIALHFSNYCRVCNRLARLVESAMATYFARADAPAVIFVDRSVLSPRT
jgi:hypothetical protein